MHLPAHGSGREIAPLVVGAELGRTVGTHGEGEEIAVQKGIVHPSVEREQLAQIVAVVVYLPHLGVAGIHVFIAEHVVHKASRRSVEPTVEFPVKGMAGHHRKVMHLVPIVGPGEVGFTQEVGIEAGVHLGYAAVVERVLGCRRGLIYIGDGGIVAVVELSVNVQSVNNPEIQRGRLCNLLGVRPVAVVGKPGQRMTEVRRSCPEERAVLIIDRPQRIAPVFKAVHDIPFVERKHGVGRKRQPVPKLILEAEVGVDLIEIVLLVNPVLVVVVDVQID